VVIFYISHRIGIQRVDQKVGFTHLREMMVTLLIHSAAITKMILDWLSLSLYPDTVNN
jgi:hypothetical protein